MFNRPLRCQRSFLVLLIFSVVLLADLAPVSELLGQERAGRGRGGGGTRGNDPQHGGGGGSDEFRLSIAGAFQEDTSPGFLLATSRYADGKLQWVYLCILNHNYSGSDEDDFPFEVLVSSSEGKDRQEVTKGDARQSVTIGDMHFSIEYVAVLDQKNGASPVESLVLNKAGVDLTKGRIFFVDLTGTTIQIDQVQFPLAPLQNSVWLLAAAEKVWDDVKKAEADGNVKRVRIEVTGKDEE